MKIGFKTFSDLETQWVVVFNLYVYFDEKFSRKCTK